MSQEINYDDAKEHRLKILAKNPEIVSRNMTLLMKKAERLAKSEKKDSVDNNSLLTVLTMELVNQIVINDSLLDKFNGLEKRLEKLEK